MSESSGDGHLDWDCVADGQGNGARGTDQSINLDGVPALVYTAFWQQKIDGRFRKASRDANKGASMTFLFDFPDFRPAALMTIDDGDYSVMPVADPAMLAKKPDALVRIRMVDAVKMLGGLGPILAAVFKGKIKMKGIRKLWLLVKVLMTKEAA